VLAFLDLQRLLEPGDPLALVSALLVALDELPLEREDLRSLLICEVSPELCVSDAASWAEAAEVSTSIAAVQPDTRR